MKKIAFIVQQYGLELCGGAELHCMRLAERMASFYKTEVLTTCSLDFLTWDNHYPEGESEINGVTVKRFRVSQLRDWGKMRELEKKVKPEKYLPVKKRGLRRILKKISARLKKSAAKEDYINWIIAQGPTTPDLIDYVKKNKEEYDCLIFFSYLYYPTVFGIDISPEKTILIPTAHDEWAVQMPVYNKVFKTPACIMYNTLAEKRLVNKLFKNEMVYSEIAGTWVIIPGELPPLNVKTDFKIHSDYILYVGRIDDNKITSQDFEWFLKYVAESKKKIKLVLIGNLYRDLPVSDNIIYLGFVDEQVKFNLIRQSLFLFQPSQFESLSIVVLEAFAMERPALVHKDCEVMKDHVDMSKGGFYYNDYAGFKYAFDQLSDDTSLNVAMGKSGRVYVDKNYSYENIIAKFQNVFENIVPNKK